MFADAHLLTQLLAFFLLLKIKRCFEKLVILLTWIRIRIDQILWIRIRIRSIRINITEQNLLDFRRCLNRLLGIL